MKPVAPAIHVVLLFCSGCAFYEKNFVSEITVSGGNYRPDVYDEGVRYVHDDPPVRMRMGCFASSTLLATMFPVIPMPFGRESMRHDSIAAQRFSLTLRHSQRDEIELSGLPIELRVGASVARLNLVGKALSEYSWEYRFAADLTCGEVQDAQLRIRLDDETVRSYDLQFEEGVRREVSWQPYFVT